MGLGRLRGPSLETGTPRACHRSRNIIAPGGWDVCDGAHWLIVMKKVKRAATSRSVNGPPARSHYPSMSVIAMFRQEGTAWLQPGILRSSIYLSSNNLAPMYKTVSVLASFSGPRPYDQVA